MSKLSTRIALVVTLALAPSVVSAAPAERDRDFFDRITESVRIVLDWFMPSADKDDSRADQIGDG